MQKILLLGSTGLLGSTLSKVLSTHHQLIRQSRTDGTGIDAVVNPNSPQALREFITRTNPDVIINAIALTDVDRCQRDAQSAFIINAGIVENIVMAIENPATHLIQISTDHLYTRYGPQKENDVDILNMYAATKLLGEIFAQRRGNSTILRTNFSGRSDSATRKSFSDWIVDSLRNHTRIRLASDLIFNPLSTISLSLVIDSVIKNPRPGVYNLGSFGATSKYEAAMEIARRLTLDTNLISRVTAEELYFPTARPTDMSMDVSLFQEHYFPLPETADEIQKIAESHEHQ